MVFGRVARAPSSLPEEQAQESYSDYVGELVHRLIEIQTLGAKNLNQAKLREKFYFDRHVNPVDFSPGDLVLVLREGKKRKFGNQYYGPFEVIELTEREDVIFKDERGVKYMKHPSKLKKFHQ